MKLYVTDTSPYARMARIMVLEKGLEARVEVLPARTREAAGPSGFLAGERTRRRPWPSAGDAR